MKKIIHFSHANGFPAESYQKFFSFLKDDYEIGYLSMHGHNPKFPVAENWSSLADELIEYVSQNYSQPVYAVGHSLGGVLSFLAAVKKPELFKGLVMLDAPVLGMIRSSGVRIAKWLRVIDRLSPAGRTQWRRTEWPNYAAAVEYFKTKELFKNFDPECLEDYVKFGTEQSPHGIRLRYDREVEYKIYRTLPHNLPKYRRQLKVPGALIYGQGKSVITPADIKEMQKYFQMETVTAQGGHLFPFEFPEEAATTLKSVLQNFPKT